MSSFGWLGWERLGGSRRLRIDFDDERTFFEKVKMYRDIRRCFIWQGAKTESGYGVHTMRGRVVPAHRASYVISRRKDIGRSLQVLHSCDTPSCVNPRHLRLGTAQENQDDRWICERLHYISDMLRGVSFERHSRRRRETRGAVKTGAPKGNGNLHLIGALVRRDSLFGATTGQLALGYSLPVSIVRSMVYRNRWSEPRRGGRPKPSSHSSIVRLTEDLRNGCASAQVGA